MDRAQELRLLSHLPIGTAISVIDNAQSGTGLTGGFAGLGLTEGKDLVNVFTKAGKAGMLLDDAVAIVVALSR